VIARVPFDEGSLTGTLTPKTKFQSNDWRGAYFTPERLKETCERVERLKTLLNDATPSLPALALKYILAHPAVSTVIPGMRKVRHVEENISLCEGEALTAEQIQELNKHRWVRNFYPVH
jgi:aryl-alcohol dehydrogenase-like predicted oxidoreductase